MTLGEADEGLALVAAECCVCGVRDSEPVGVGEDFEYRTSPDTFLAVQCRGCGLVYLDPRPDAAEFGRIYPDSYHAFDFSDDRYGLVFQVRRRLEARRLLRFCRDLPADAMITDVGCGDGFHLRLLQEFGRKTWQLQGIDFDSRAAKVAAEHGLLVHVGDVATLDLPSESVDLAFMIQTIEHVEDPVAALTAVRKLLKPGGRLVVVTDNTATADFALFRSRYWGGYHFPRHWNLFNRKALARLARKTGFDVDRIGTIVSPVNWTYSVRNTLDDLGAPRPVVKWFGLDSPAALGVFTILDTLFRGLGHGALLRAELRRPR